MSGTITPAHTPTSALTLQDGEQTPPRYELGDVDERGRYSVTVNGTLTGHVARWHGIWHATTATGLTLPHRHPDRHTAAQQLADLSTTSQPSPDATPTTSARTSPYAHLLDPGLAATTRTIVNAAIALARLNELAWQPVAGYPGADNRWLLRCLVCSDARASQDLLPWTGARFWSHLRGRNGDNIPRPLCRHDGCLPIKEHPDRLAHITPAPAPACPCAEQHPTTPQTAKPLLAACATARRRHDEDSLHALLTRLLGPCPASRARATALAT